MEKMQKRSAEVFKMISVAFLEFNDHHYKQSLNRHKKHCWN